MTSLVLVQALVVGPVGARDVRAARALLTVPLGVPELVGLRIAGSDLGDQQPQTRVKITLK